MNKRAVTSENNRLLLLFNGVDENRLNFVREHVRQLAWYNCEIRDLQQNIEKSGITVPFQNGKNQSGLQSNPDLKALCDLQKLASAMVKILLPLVPEKQRTGGKLEALRSDIFSELDCEEDPEEVAERERQEEERRRRIEEEIKMAAEQQRREREQQA